MLKSVKISKFRCFEDFAVEKLGRVNLFVGLNNAGKTCFLEAIDLLRSGNPASLAAAAVRRGEVVLSADLNGAFRNVIEIRHAFFGHVANIGSEFQISGQDDSGPMEFKASISSPTPSNSKPQEAAAPVQGIPAPMTVPGQAPTISPVVETESKALVWSATPGLQNRLLRLERDELQLPIPAQAGVPRAPVRYVGTNSMPANEAAQVFSNFAGRPKEKLVLEALRIIEEDIERLLVTVVGTASLFVTLKSVSDRIPLGNLGDGVTRLLGLSCQLAQAENGYLLVDEIDRGLHVSTMEKMWKLVISTAIKLNIQIFATTHSDDCLRGLAQCLKNSKELGDSVMLHTVNRGAQQPVSYDAEEIIRTAKARIEVRV